RPLAAPCRRETALGLREGGSFSVLSCAFAGVRNSWLSPRDQNNAVPLETGERKKNRDPFVNGGIARIGNFFDEGFDGFTSGKPSDKNRINPTRDILVGS
ncbi:unnamed protein product, partial [Ixodes persulcatus]